MTELGGALGGTAVPPAGAKRRRAGDLKRSLPDALLELPRRRTRRTVRLLARRRHRRGTRARSPALVRRRSATEDGLALVFSNGAAGNALGSSGRNGDWKRTATSPPGRRAFRGARRRSSRRSTAARRTLVDDLLEAAGFPDAALADALRAALRLLGPPDRETCRTASRDRERHSRLRPTSRRELEDSGGRACRERADRARSRSAPVRAQRVGSVLRTLCRQLSTRSREHAAPADGRSGRAGAHGKRPRDAARHLPGGAGERSPRSIFSSSASGRTARTRCRASSACAGFGRESRASVDTAVRAAVAAARSSRRGSPRSRPIGRPSLAAAITLPLQGRDRRAAREERGYRLFMSAASYMIEAGLAAAAEDGATLTLDLDEDDRLSCETRRRRCGSFDADRGSRGWLAPKAPPATGWSRLGERFARFSLAGPPRSRDTRASVIRPRPRRSCRTPSRSPKRRRAGQTARAPLRRHDGLCAQSRGNATGSSRSPAKAARRAAGDDHASRSRGGHAGQTPPPRRGESALRRLALSTISRRSMRRPAFVVAPLFSGGGTRIKLLDAAAHVVPIVATTAAARGFR